MSSILRSANFMKISLTCERWRLDHLNEVTQLDQSGCVYLDHGETGDQIIGQLIVARDQAQGKCGHRRDAPSVVESLKQSLF
jgi:hypothetical protein